MGEEVICTKCIQDGLSVTIIIRLPARWAVCGIV